MLYNSSTYIYKSSTNLENVSVANNFIIFLMNATLQMNN